MIILEEIYKNLIKEFHGHILNIKCQLTKK